MDETYEAAMEARVAAAKLQTIEQIRAYLRKAYEGWWDYRTHSINAGHDHATTDVRLNQIAEAIKIMER